MKTRRALLVFCFLIGAHALRLIDAARRLAPTWDEIAYAAAGWAQLKTGSIDLNTMAPYLGKLLYALALIPLNPMLPFSHVSWQEKKFYRFGFEFLYRNSISPHWLIFFSRLPVIVLSVGLGILLGLWMRKRWG